MANSAINSVVQLNGLQLLSISHLPDDQGARKIIAALGLDWPTHPGRFTERLYESEGDGVKLVWRSPRELLAIAHSDSALQSLRDAMVPGRLATAAVWNQSHAMALFELQGPDLDAWLTRLVDAEAIPRTKGHSSRCRLADIAVQVLRLDHHRAWLLADKPITAYVRNWLDFTHAALPHQSLAKPQNN